MSLPNEHSAVIRELIPKNAAVTTVKQIAPGISIILQRYKGDSDKPQQIRSYRFKKSRYTEDEVKAWLKSHSVGYTDFEPAKETEPYSAVLDRVQKELSSKNLICSENEFLCQCISCGHIMKSSSHCMDIKCAKCGGKMRRYNRPGIGR